MAPLVAGRQPVAQPSLGLADDLDVGLSESDLLVEFPIQRLLGLFPCINMMPTLARNP